MRRIGADAGRPLLRRADLAEIYRRRLPVYRSVATLTVPTTGRPAEAVCQEVISRLAREPGLPPGRPPPGPVTLAEGPGRDPG
jgi:shikimate kinase